MIFLKYINVSLAFILGAGNFLFSILEKVISDFNVRQDGMKKKREEICCIPDVAHSA